MESSRAVPNISSEVALAIYPGVALKSLKEELLESLQEVPRLLLVFFFH